MNLLLIFLLGIAQQPADSAVKAQAAMDSLYVARDTAALERAVRAWSGESNARIQLYRGLSAAWTGRATQAIGILRPLLDSVSNRLTPIERRDAIRALAESYSRKRDYASAATLYDSELKALDAEVDSANARAAVVKTDTVVVNADSLLEALTSTQSAPPPSPEKISSQLGLIGLLFALFLVPKALQRFRIPGAITALLMGVAASMSGLLPNDVTLRLFSTLGIVSLFLFAGLEIDGHELRRNVKPLILHAAIWTTLAVGSALAARAIFGLPTRAAALLSLALVTPSTGFILSTLPSFGLTADERSTVRTYAIGSELIALTALST